MKLGLATRGKQNLEHDDVSQEVYIYVCVCACARKSEVSKSYIIVNALYIPKF